MTIDTDRLPKLQPWASAARTCLLQYMDRNDQSAVAARSAITKQTIAVADHFGLTVEEVVAIVEESPL